MIRMRLGKLFKVIALYIGFKASSKREIPIRIRVRFI
jgi:hypothetical protein